MDPLRGVLAVALPAVIAGALLLLRRRWAGALAAGLGILAGILALFAPKLTGQAAPLLALVALAGAGVGAVPPGRARVALLAALATLPPLVGLWFLSEDYMSRGTKLAWGAGETLAVFVSILAADVWAGRRDSWGSPVVLWVIASAGALAVAISVYVSGGQVAGSVAAVLGALAVLGWWKPTEGAIRAAVPAVASVLAGTWLVAYHMQDFALLPTALLLSAPLLLWTGELTKKKVVTPIAVTVLCLVIVGVSLPQEIWDKVRGKPAETQGE